MTPNSPMSPFPPSSLASPPSEGDTSPRPGASRQRSHPFMNLTFTSLHDPHGASRTEARPRRSTSHGSGADVEVGYPSSSGASTPGRRHKRTHTHDSSTSTRGDGETYRGEGERRTPSASAPSSPRLRPRTISSASATVPLDPHKEYFFTPSRTPVVLPPSEPRLRKRSDAGRSAPNSPRSGLSPANSSSNLAGYASNSMGLRRSVSIGKSGEALDKLYRTASNGFPTSMSALSVGSPQDNSPFNFERETSDDDEQKGLSFGIKTMNRGKLSRKHSHASDTFNGCEEAVQIQSRQVKVEARVSRDEFHDDEAMIMIPLLNRNPSHQNEEGSALVSLSYISILPPLVAVVPSINPIDPYGAIVLMLWASVTSYHLFSLTRGLLSRWLTKFPAFPHTLIRLLALQVAIIWPAAQFSLRILKKIFPLPFSQWCAFATATGLVAQVVITATSRRGSNQVYQTWSWKPVAITYAVMSWYLLSDPGNDRSSFVATNSNTFRSA